MPCATSWKKASLPAVVSFLPKVGADETPRPPAPKIGDPGGSVVCVLAHALWRASHFGPVSARSLVRPTRRSCMGLDSQGLVAAGGLLPCWAAWFVVQRTRQERCDGRRTPMMALIRFGGALGLGHGSAGSQVCGAIVRLFKSLKKSVTPKFEASLRELAWCTCASIEGAAYEQEICGEGALRGPLGYSQPRLEFCSLCACIVTGRCVHGSVALVAQEGAGGGRATLLVLHLLLVDLLGSSGGLVEHLGPQL